METTIYKGKANIYYPETQRTDKNRYWRDKFTKEQVLEWMERRKRFLNEILEFDEITWSKWEDGCYRMIAYRKEKKSKKGRKLNSYAISYIFKPIK